MKVRMKVSHGDLFYYPDVMVACEPDDRHRFYRERPKFWIEVSSEDKNKDRVEQYFACQSIPSMEEYVVVNPDPDDPGVEVFRKENNWDVELIKGGDLTFRSIGVTVSIDSLYAKLRLI